MVLAGAASLAFAQQVDVGKREYGAVCATCHGPSGTGDGPMAGYLSGRLPDLTTLAKRNNGVFPFAHVYDTIDGTAAVKGHGSREMPVWGPRYMEKSTEHYRDFPAPYDAEAFVRGRILALTEYVYRLQKK
ncbi:MAG: c-type cytochrome [Betaproteobacteria bacterium]|nr:c-type cytochrome [Betaproteobacteria bacterium]MDH5220251.1 c-type cytochrome [Betaproteobacteria bacterium]MDH5350094.1 c-type cytochrome [Betaproteobacteria bacterium]